MNFLLNNSVLLVFLVTMILLAAHNVHRKMKYYGITFQEYLKILKINSFMLAKTIYFEMVTIIMLTVLSSLVLFGNLWTSDAFHLILFCSLLHKRAKLAVLDLLG